MTNNCAGTYDRCSVEIDKGGCLVTITGVAGARDDGDVIKSNGATCIHPPLIYKQKLAKKRVVAIKKKSGDTSANTSNNSALHMTDTCSERTLCRCCIEVDFY